jgi:ATP-dependent DNA helicase RecG
MQLTFQTPIEYLKDVGPANALHLQKEINIYKVSDLASYYPFRYEDRSQLHKIDTIHKGLPYVQLKGKLGNINLIEHNKKRLTATLQDDTGIIKLIWFEKINNIRKHLQPGMTYQAFGRVTNYQGIPGLIHPELHLLAPTTEKIAPLLPIYHTTEKMKKHGMDSRYIRRLQKNWIERFPSSLAETIPAYIRQQYHLVDRKKALMQIHFPDNIDSLKSAQLYLKFEELFYIQLRLLQLRAIRIEKQAAIPYSQTDLLTTFYRQHLPFSLTGAQKRVVKEIYTDLRSGSQMNRLLQGDVGSGKTIVAFLAMLIVVGSEGQVALMAPTEILAEQHYKKFLEFGKDLSLQIRILTGATKPKERTNLLAQLAQGEISILIGTHSLINENVSFKNLGLAIIDEQQRFGVAQRAGLWKKPSHLAPHVLVMSATPIPRTLAMTLYGDLDISILDEMPTGRQPVKTFHYYDAQRLKVFQLIRNQLAQGRQAYVVYPIIEESDTTDYKNLLDGYESLCRAFPDVPLSIVHGKMKASDKAYEMYRFAKGETKIMVATTVIEVGMNVPNATLMLIENADRFGLAQLHQLRGRVGRGDQTAYCILMTNYKLAPKTKERISALVRTTNGFEIADMDLRLRGPGNLTGLQQSGGLELKIANLATDGSIVQLAREAAKAVIQADPPLENPCHHTIKLYLANVQQAGWGHIS